MDNSVILAILTIIGSVVGSVLGVWALTRKNKSEVEKQEALSQVRAKDADTKERSDLIDMIKESTKQGNVWLESLKVIEHTRELDYATLKAIIEDGTKETINSRKELLSKLAEMSKLDVEHNTGITTSFEEVKRELASMKGVVDTLPGEYKDVKRRLDELLGYIDRLLPKLARATSEMQAAATPAPEAAPASP